MGMKWYSGLYLGDSVRHPRRLRWKIDHNAGTMAYVIALSTAENGILDIIPTWVLLQKGYPWRGELFAVGLAQSHGEALEVVRRIVDETWQNTGTVDVRSWLKRDRRAEE